MRTKTGKGIGPLSVFLFENDMKNLKVKPEFIGATTHLPGIGQTKIREDHVNILAQAGRWELLDGDQPDVKKLEPVVEEPVTKKKSRKK